MSTPAAVHGQTLLNRSVSQSSKEWVSPFRKSQPATISQKKPTTTPEVEAVETAEQEATSAKDVEDVEDVEETEEALDQSFDNDAIVDEGEEPLAAQPEETEKTEEPTTAEEIEQNKEAADQDENAETPVDAEPAPAAAEEEEDKVVEPAGTPVEKTIAKIEDPVKDILTDVPETIRTHPKMLKRYKENINIASNVMNTNHIENLGRRVNLGAGLILTEQQIYELARKKLEPTMKQIDARVAENNARDAEKAFQVEEKIRLQDEAVVAGMLASYNVIVEARKKESQQEHDTLFQEVEDEAANSKTLFEKYIQDQTDGIAGDNEKAKKEEEEAGEAHLTNKMDILNNGEQYKADKAQELEDTKAKQIEEADASKKFEADAAELKEKHEALEKELEAKKAELEEKIKKVEELIAAKHDKQQQIRSSTKRKKVADRLFGIINAKHAQAAANAAILGTQVGLLTQRATAHSTKIDHLNGPAKEILQSKKVEAANATEEWNQHLQQVRIDEAKKQEQIKIAAEEERKRLEQEKLEEEERAAKQKEEDEKIQKEKLEQERLAKEKELEEKSEAEKKKKEEQEKEAARMEEEVERLKKLKQLKEEKLALEKSLKEEDEKSKAKSTAILAGIGGAAIGTVAAGAVAGAAIAGTAASSTANAAGSLSGSASDALGGKKSVNVSSYQDELKNSTAGTGTPQKNPFYTGEFNDKSDLPSVIHEADELQANTETTASEPASEIPTAEPTTAPTSGSDSNYVTVDASKPGDASNRTPVRTPAEIHTAKVELTGDEPEVAESHVDKSKPVFPETSKHTADELSVVPSGTSDAEISEAKAVKISSNDQTAQKIDETDDTSGEEDSMIRQEHAPIFTEKIGSETSPTSAGILAQAEESKSGDENDASDACTLVTITSEEYRAHDGDPNYMVIEE